MMQQTPLDLIKKYPHLLSSLPPEVKAEIADGLEELAERENAEKSKQHFMNFVRSVWPAS